MPASNATSRFSDRVENYVRYRPGYPPDVIEELKAECGLVPDDVVADIASGTGIWTRMLLENGNPVFGIEPNAEMRESGRAAAGKVSEIHEHRGNGRSNDAYGSECRFRHCGAGCALVSP